MKLGEYQKLKVIKKVEFGVYLAEHEGDETRVLLPQKQVPADAKLGDEIEVFLYKDSKDRIIATTNQPKLTPVSYTHLDYPWRGTTGSRS